jgi:glyoxylase I family protein
VVGRRANNRRRCPPTDEFDRSYTLAFRVDTIDELNEIAQRAGGRAWPETLSSVRGQGINGGTIQNVYLTDPDGIRIECMTGTPDFAAM